MEETPYVGAGNPLVCYAPTMFGISIHVNAVTTTVPRAMLPPIDRAPPGGMTMEPSRSSSNAHGVFVAVAAWTTFDRRDGRSRVMAAPMVAVLNACMADAGPNCKLLFGVTAVPVTVFTGEELTAYTMQPAVMVAETYPSVALIMIARLPEAGGLKNA